MEFIEAGIIQRAELLSRLLEDLYGDQTLLKAVIFRPRCCSAILRFCGRWSACLSPNIAICICSLSILPDLRMASGGCLPTARRRLRAAGTRWKIAPLSLICCLNFFARRMCGAWLRFSVHNARR